MLQGLLIYAIPTVVTLAAAFLLIRNIRKEERQHGPAFPRPGSSNTSNSRPGSVRQRRSNRNDPECAICFERKPAVELYPCSHRQFCADCINKIIENGKRTCPLCRKHFRGYSDCQA